MLHWSESRQRTRQRDTLPLQHENTLRIQFRDQACYDVGFALQIPVLTQGDAGTQYGGADRIGSEEGSVLHVITRLDVGVGREPLHLDSA